MGGGGGSCGTGDEMRRRDSYRTGTEPKKVLEGRGIAAWEGR